MKNQLKNILALTIAAALFISCANDDKDQAISGTGSLGVEFDNAFAANDLALNSANSATSNNEILKIASVKYIVSNIVLTDQDGHDFTYPKSESYFIVDESDEASLVLDLEDIPAANYVKIRFGIGVDQAQYGLGFNAQGAFLDMAQAAGLYSTWAEGYKFLSVTGSFTSGAQPNPTPFSILTGKTDAAYNYKEITLALPSKALVRTDITPEIHIIADLSKLIDGPHKLKLSETSQLNAGENVGFVTQNLDGLFTVAHVHND